MILPYHLLAIEFGLSWRMSPAECLSVLQCTPVRSGNDWLQIMVDVQGDQCKVSLLFDDLGLGCIDLVTHESRDFFDYVEQDERQAIEQEYENTYTNVVSEASVVLGQPDYVRESYHDADEMGILTDVIGEPQFIPSSGLPGNERLPGHPFTWLWGCAWKFNLWKQDSANFLVEFDQQDSELSITVTVAAMRPVNTANHRTRESRV